MNNDAPTAAPSDLPPHLVPVGAARGRRVVVVADGEHYPSVVADAVSLLRSVGWQVVAVALVGGSEKLRDEPDYGVPVVLPRDGGPVATVLAACTEHGVDMVVDLSDEPVLTWERRMALIGALASAGISYAGADTTFAAPTFSAVATPSLAVIGTGKRIGKTAISAHLARLADAALGGNGEVVVVAMGRGGPAEPVVVDRAGGTITVERLLELSRDGLHAASDYLEDAALTGLTTIGCRRAGGGLLGAPVTSNVPAGAALVDAMSPRPRLAIFEGSGSCVPPVDVDASLMLGTSSRPRDLIDDLGAYRLARANLLLVVGDDLGAAAPILQRLARTHPGLRTHAVRLQPTPVESIAGMRVAIFTTAPASAVSAIERAATSADAELVFASHALARRDELRADVARAIACGVDGFAVEIKAAGIDVVAEAADAAGIPITFLDNRPISHDPDIDLDAELAALAVAAADGAAAS